MVDFFMRPLLLKILAKLVTFGLLVAIVMFIGLAGFSATLLSELPTVDEIRDTPLHIPLRIYSTDAKLIAEYGNERRIPITIDHVPPLLIDAILATEDNEFYHHTGVDFFGLLRAFINNLMSRSRGQGGSTITMQVARNFFLNPEKTYTRKIKEILLAFNMERALTKDEILELYLNKIFLGHRAYGFGAAARIYYNTELQNLSVAELAMLAGLPKAPSRDNPISNSERAMQRRAYVLKRLHALGHINEVQLQRANTAPITAQRHRATLEYHAPYIAEMARTWLLERYGTSAYEIGLNVTVTVHSAYQNKANQSLRAGLLAYDQRHGFRGAIAHIDPPALNDEQAILAVLTVLDRYPASQDLVPAVVTAIEAKQFSAFTQNGTTATVGWEQIKWARKHLSANALGPALQAVTDILRAGDIIYLRQLPVAQPEVHPNDRTKIQPNVRWGLSQLPEVSGSLVSIDPNSGAILALTGGFDYFLSKFNRATQAKRQPGSNIKPFIYSAAFAHGFTPSSLVSAGPIVVENKLEGLWRPQNYSKKFYGPTRLRKALSLSLNLVSVRLLRAVGMRKTIAHLEKFGFVRERLIANLSLALGSTSVTPIELVASFAVIANGGQRIRPYLIEKIEDANGQPLVWPEPCPTCENQIGEQQAVEPLLVGEVARTGDGDQSVENSANANDSTNQAAAPPAAMGITPQNAFLTRNIMKQVVLSGTATRALSLNRFDLAGKTGTTNDFKDAWFSGFTPDVTTTIFVGFDKPKHLGYRESGAAAALPIWIDFMARVLPDYPEKEEVIPDHITTRFINKHTAQVTTLDDPDGYTEYYLDGTEPNNPVYTAPDPSSSTPSPNQSATDSLF